MKVDFSLSDFNPKVREQRVLHDLSQKVHPDCSSDCTKAKMEKQRDPATYSTTYRVACTARSCTRAERQAAMKVWYDEADLIPSLPVVISNDEILDELADLLDPPDRPSIEGAGAW